MKKRYGPLIHLAIISLILLVTWLIYDFVFDYIKIWDMVTAYSLLWFAVLLALITKRYLFAYITSLSTCIGLIAGYTIASNDRKLYGYATSSSVVTNLMIIAFGIIIGITAQLIYKIVSGLIARKEK